MGVEKLLYFVLLQVWKKYYELTKEYFSGVTLADLAAEKPGNDYMI